MSTLDNKVVQFGKFRGKTYFEIKTEEPRYCQWLLDQPNFKTSHPDLVKYLKEEIEKEDRASCTPEHNEIQARFITDRAFVHEFFLLLKAHYEEGSMPWVESESVEIEFDLIEAEYRMKIGHNSYVSVDVHIPLSLSSTRTKSVLVEIKPTVGDDYPKVLREMKNWVKAWDPNKIHVLYVRQYAGSVRLEDIKAIFKRSGIVLILERKPQVG